MPDHKNNISLFRKSLYALIVTASVIILSEIIVSVFYYHQYGNRKSALVELYYNIKKNIQQKNEVDTNREKNYYLQQLVRPDSSKEVNHRIYDETMLANKFVYTPWLEFRVADFAGKYVNTKGFIRKSQPDLINRSTDTITIWFFGGSTMYGFNVSDFETIPAAFCRLYGTTGTSQKTLQVVNYGIPYYYSFQEKQLFHQLLQEMKAPDIAVFLDGLNDFLNYNTSFTKTTFFSESFGKLIQKQQRDLFTGKAITDYFPYSSLTGSQSDSLVNTFLKTLKTIEQEGKNASSSTLFVLQPTPFYNYRNKNNDTACSKENLPLFNHVYPKLKTEYSGRNNYLFLGDIHNNFNKQPYVDAVHYSPSFNEYIASLILEHLNL